MITRHTKLKFFMVVDALVQEVRRLFINPIKVEVTILKINNKMIFCIE